MSMYIYVTEPADLDPVVIRETLASSDWKPTDGDVSFSGSQEQPYEALLIRSNTKVDASILDYFPSLKHVVRAGVGLDNVDVDFCKSHDIKIYNAPGANADAVSDYTVGMMLFALRKLYKKTREDVENWNRFKFVGQNMANQTVGIVGYGNIGRQVERKLRGFNCKQVLIYDPFLPENVELQPNMRVATFEEILREATLISLHLPLTDQTKYLIGKHNLALVQENAVIINASRGGIVEETAVIAALQTKDFVYVADAVEDEPAVNKDLLAHDNIIITPHIASLTDESERGMVRLALQNLLDEKTAVIF